jgi:probable phosphoglycerate mutase
MDESVFKLYLIRHGDTAWSEAHRHTGLTDLPLDRHGEHQARRLGKRLEGLSFTRIFTSPLRRARATCELAGFAVAAKTDPDLVEWNYGDYEGLTTVEIRRRRSEWDLFRDGVPNGESPRDVAARADRFIAKALRRPGDVVVFSSAHIIRMIAARWLSLPPDAARLFLSSTASVSILGYEHSRAEAVIRLWNDVGEIH